MLGRRGYKDQGLKTCESKAPENAKESRRRKVRVNSRGALTELAA